LCKFTRKISYVENLHDLNMFFYMSSKKSTFKAGNKAQIHTIFFNRVASWAQTQDLRLICPPSYSLGYCVDLNMKKNINHIKTIDFEHACVLNRHSNNV
jgi:hypothetical protein